MICATIISVSRVVYEFRSKFSCYSCSASHLNVALLQDVAAEILTAKTFRIDFPTTVYDEHSSESQEKPKLDVFVR